MVLNRTEIHLKIQNEIYLYVYPLKTPFMRKKSSFLFDSFLVIRTILEVMTV